MLTELKLIMINSRNLLLAVRAEMNYLNKGDFKKSIKKTLQVIV